MGERYRKVKISLPPYLSGGWHICKLVHVLVPTDPIFRGFFSPLQ
mgnify:CR=1 FL=1